MKRFLNSITVMVVSALLGFLCLTGSSKLLPTLESQTPASFLFWLSGFFGLLYCFLLLIFVLMFFWALFGRGIPLLARRLEKNSVIEAFGGEIIFIPETTYEWWWEENIIGREQKPIKTYFEFDFDVHPITENPRVHQLHYSLIIVLKRNAEGIQKLKARVGNNWMEWDKHVRMLLYDFNHKNSKGFTAFNNPLREEQQANFQKFVSDELREHLKEAGLFLKSARFSLNS